MQQQITQLPLVNPFDTAYEKWIYRKATLEEVLGSNDKVSLLNRGIKDRLECTVSNILDCAMVMVQSGYGCDNELECQIDNNLSQNASFKFWLGAMPSKIPKYILEYKNSYRTHNPLFVDKEINNLGFKLSTGQMLVHAGAWNNEDNFIISRPLSTSLSPQVAILNAIHGGKAYNMGKIDVLLLEVVNPNTNVFVFKTKNLSLGHEKEILFASGARISLKNKVCVGQMRVIKFDENSREIDKIIPVNLIHAYIS